MSHTTLYLALSAAVLVGLWLVNAVFYRRRHGSFLPRTAERQANGGKRLGTQDVLAASLFVGMLLLAKAAPYVMPGSAFALWLEEPWLQSVLVRPILAAERDVRGLRRGQRPAPFCRPALFG